MDSECICLVILNLSLQRVALNSFPIGLQGEEKKASTLIEKLIVFSYLRISRYSKSDLLCYSLSKLSRTESLEQSDKSEIIFKNKQS